MEKYTGNVHGEKASVSFVRREIIENLSRGLAGEDFEDFHRERHWNYYWERRGEGNLDV